MLPRAGCQVYSPIPGKPYVVSLFSLGFCSVCTLPPLGHLCIWLWSEQDTCPIWQWLVLGGARALLPALARGPPSGNTSRLFGPSPVTQLRTSVALSGCVLPFSASLSLPTFFPLLSPSSQHQDPWQGRWDVFTLQDGHPSCSLSHVASAIHKPSCTHHKCHSHSCPRWGRARGMRSWGSAFSQGRMESVLGRQHPWCLLRHTPQKTLNMRKAEPQGAVGSLKAASLGERCLSREGG